MSSQYERRTSLLLASRTNGLSTFSVKSGWWNFAMRFYGFSALTKRIVGRHLILNLSVASMYQDISARGQAVFKERSPRVACAKSARIFLDNGTNIDCVIQNCSRTGICIEAESPTRIPDSFKLASEADQSKRRCRVVWRFGKRIGLAFE
jgi:hypothetical protein